MHSLDSLRDIRNLEGYLGILPGESNCDSYTSYGMGLQEMHDAFPRRNESIRRPGIQGKVTAVLVYNLRTREIRVEEPAS